MEFVHIFASRGRFDNERELGEFVEPAYTDDGDLTASKFMREIGLINNYEPMAIERELFRRPIDLLSALVGFSYADQFPVVRTATTSVDTVICVYSPNDPTSPQKSSLDYIGAFPYDPRKR